MSKITIRLRVGESEVVFSLRPDQIREVSADEFCKKWIIPSLAGMVEAALADYQP